MLKAEKTMYSWVWPQIHDSLVSAFSAYATGTATTGGFFFNYVKNIKTMPANIVKPPYLLICKINYFYYLNMLLGKKISLLFMAWDFYYNKNQD